MVHKYDNTVEVLASLLIVNKKGEILLIKSPKWGDLYLIPGGHVEYGETIFKAAKREGEEETGLKLKPLYCVNVGELIHDPNFARKAHLIYFHIVCEPLTEKIILDDKEIKKYIWIKPKKALMLNLISGIDITIKNYINGIRIAL